MKTIPVIYIHYGTIPPYLVRSVNCAAAFKNTILVISDTEFNFKNSAVKQFPVHKYEKELGRFQAIYKHRCNNSEEFERRCINRWFILRNFMQENNIETCYYSDSDAMIYDNVSNIYPFYSEYDASFVKSESQENFRWAASACCSYWKKETIIRFCDFILQLYEPGKRTPLDEKWEYHIKNNIPGGICDMTLLYLFSEEINFYSLSKVKDNLAFDSNVLIPGNYYEDEYEMMLNVSNNRLMKKLVWKNGLPYGINKVLHNETRFAALTEYAKLVSDKVTIWDRIGRKIKTMSN